MGPHPVTHPYPRFVGLHERDLCDLLEAFPKLTRAEIRMVIESHGPERSPIERELERLSASKS